jgi:FkbM family methyltransferase
MEFRRIVGRAVKPQLISRIKALILRHELIAKIFRFRYFALNALDKKLEYYLDFDNGYFVELGANDGVNQSNTLYFERFRGWKGVLVEPYQPNFENLMRNRSSINFFKNVACVGPSYKKSTISLAYSNLMTSTLGIESEISNPVGHAVQGADFWGGESFIFDAAAQTLGSLLVEACAPVLIDLLSLDVEGVELEILKGVDHTIFSFRYICVESRKFDELHKYLTDLKYQYVEALSTHDHLFRKMLKA